jgi:transglycosylase-like protein with SLT domain
MVVASTGTQGGGSAVVGAIRNAARATGANFQYLLATAQVESGLNPTAAETSSSARGLFQFIEQTWLTTLKEAGPALGYARYANAIVQSPSGRYDVSDPAMRKEIMALRDDPTANAAMAGAFTQQNAARLAERIGRTPSEGELYVAHFFGASGAAQLINLAGSNPNATAASVFPSAAKANPSIFYDRQGNARSVVGVYRGLVARYDVARATPAAPATGAVAANAQTPTAPPLELAAVAAATAAAANAPAPQPDARPVFHSLFRSEGERTPVSQFVRDLWTTNPRVAAALTGQAQTAPSATSSPPAAPSNAPLDLFSDQQSDAKALFGARS